MHIPGYWQYHTSVGTFSIRPTEGGFAIMFEDQAFDNYPTPDLAAQALAHGHTFAAGPETADLGIPEDISDWKFVED